MLPKLDNRLTVLGSTGSGKTTGGLYIFGSAYGPHFATMPFVMIDFKIDNLIYDIGAVEIPLSGGPPKEPGLYVVRPLPGEDEFLSVFFRKCWEQENIGIFVDEGTMLPARCKWVRACLTQGRSKHIPMVILSQRPVNLDKYVFTEASYFAIFNINNIEDRKFTRNYLDGTMPRVLPAYHFMYYDVAKNTSKVYSPVPDAETIVEKFKQFIPNKLMRI